MRSVGEVLDRFIVTTPTLYIVKKYLKHFFRLVLYGNVVVVDTL